MAHTRRNGRWPTRSDHCRVWDERGCGPVPRGHPLLFPAFTEHQSYLPGRPDPALEGRGPGDRATNRGTSGLRQAALTWEPGNRSSAPSTTPNPSRSPVTGGRVAEVIPPGSRCGPEQGRAGQGGVAASTCAGQSSTRASPPPHPLLRMLSPETCPKLCTDTRQETEARM